LSTPERGGRWWSLPPAGHPPSLIRDNSQVQAARLGLQLSTATEGEITAIRTKLRRAAALLEVGLLSARQEDADAWATYALILEGTGLSSYERAPTDIVLSAMGWQLASAPPIGAVLARRLILAETFDLLPVVAKAALKFSSRDFTALSEFSSGLLSEDPALQESTPIERALLQSLAKSLHMVADYVRFLGDEIPDNTQLSDLAILANALDDPTAYRISRLLHLCLARFTQFSSRSVIQRQPSLDPSSRQRVDQYLRSYPELWPSQTSAIELGLLDPSKQHFIVSVPTSSGKTLCGELAIIQQLTASPGSVCFYVVPTRALVTEKSRDLASKMAAFGFRVVGATGALQRDQLEATLIENAEIVVLTPEKLDLLIRHDDPALKRARAFVIDETHMVSDPDRGLGLEFVVVKLLLILPDVRIILLSAMLPNAEQFGLWLSSQATVSSSQWRPTRQRFGSIAFLPTPPRGCQLFLTLQDSSQDAPLSLRLAQYSRKPSSLLDGLVLATDALRRKGPLLVFSMTKDRCEQIVAAMVDRLASAGDSSPPAPGVESLQRKIRREIAPGFLLERSLSYGIAYHHADLPPRIRIDLEDLIGANQIDVIVSTTTLAEGVNLPISTVIFEDWIHHTDPRKGIRPTPLDLTKFRNIAGRAGRAGLETEGLVLFYEPSRTNKQVRPPDSEARISPLEYFVRPSYPPVLSRFLEIVESYKPPDEDALAKAWALGDQDWKQEVRRALRQFGAAVLHAMEVLPYEDEGLIDAVIDRSLLAVQRPEAKQSAKHWFRTWMSHYRKLTEITPELRGIAMRVGLPLRAIHRLHEATIANHQLQDAFRSAPSAPLALTTAQVELAANAVASVEELDWRPANAPHGDLLASWIEGASINDLVELYSPHLTETTRLVERTCNYATQQLSNSGAWGMYALVRILELILGPEEVCSLAARLPLFAYFGVDCVPASVLSLMGIERIDSIRLGFRYMSDAKDPPTAVSLRSWAQSLGKEELRRTIQGVDSRAIDEETLRILRVPAPESS